MKYIIAIITTSPVATGKFAIAFDIGALLTDGLLEGGNHIHHGPEVIVTGGLTDKFSFEKNPACNISRLERRTSLGPKAPSIPIHEPKMGSAQPDERP